MIAKIADIKALLARGRVDPTAAFPELKRLAASDQWQTREVAATALVEIGKRHPTAVIRNARKWARNRDESIRRAACEGLRGIIRLDPEGVRPVIESLLADNALYVRKSVANVLRDAGTKHPDFVLAICRTWSRSRDLNTQWIVTNGLRKLKVTRPLDVAEIVARIAPKA